MSLKVFLIENNAKLADLWYEAIFETYPEDSRGFISESKDKFANPVGYTIRKQLLVLLDELTEPQSPARLITALEEIVRIRAVQDFSPSEAVGFLFLLKKIIREKYHDAKKDVRLCRSLLEFESAVDQAASMAFDIYMRMKEKIYEIKAGEVKNRFERIVDRLNRKYEELP